MASYAQVERLMDSATTALEAADYGTAEQKATAALGILAVLPIEARKEGHASGSFQYSETLINEFITRVAKLGSRKVRGSSSLGIQTAKYRLTGSNCEGDDE